MVALVDTTHKTKVKIWRISSGVHSYGEKLMEMQVDKILSVIKLTTLLTTGVKKVLSNH